MYHKTVFLVKKRTINFQYNTLYSTELEFVWNICFSFLSRSGLHCSIMLPYNTLWQPHCKPIFSIFYNESTFYRAFGLKSGVVVCWLLISLFFFSESILKKTNMWAYNIYSNKTCSMIVHVFILWVTLFC